jgi:coenzyme F420 hydrogenase subunit beta
VSVLTPELAPAVPRNFCTDCGISRSSEPKNCATACQFITPDYPALEVQVQGRGRKAETDELFFGPYRRMVRARMRAPVAGAQWTGITTSIAARLLAGGHVDAVLAVGPDPADKWKPVPVIVTDAADIAQIRGMRMGYAPLLALLEPAAARGYRRIAIIGIPCQVYALRALEKSLGFERIYVIGTPCSDNTTTANFHKFLGLLSPTPELISYLEFLPDYHVELRFSDGRAAQKIPFLKLPLADLPTDFFPMTCRTCVDYTNVLADVTVGYMAGTGAQWLLVRNERGEELVALLGDELVTSPVVSAGKRAGAVKGFLINTARAAGGLPLRRMPNFMRGVMAWVMPRFGPRGLEFAKARVEMKAVETVLHLRRAAPARMKNMVPAHVWKLVEPYGLTPEDGA